MTVIDELIIHSKKKLYMVNKKLKAFSKSNDHRIVAFTIETPLGSTVKFEGCVTKKDSAAVVKMAEKIIKLTNKVE